MNIAVKAVINGDSFMGYEFETTVSLTLEDHEPNFFRLEEWEDKTRILVASQDSYYISDDVTKYFDVKAIQEEIAAQMQTGEVVDATEDYYGFFEDENEDKCDLCGKKVEPEFSLCKGCDTKVAYWDEEKDRYITHEGPNYIFSVSAGNYIKEVTS